MVEPWLRGTLQEFDPLRRQVLHALLLTEEDVERWCAGLTAEECEARPLGISPVGFHLRHIARSLDRLLTYAEGSALTEAQLLALTEENVPAGDAMEELRAALATARARVRAFAPAAYAEPRFVGRDRLPTTVGSLLVHCADHSQRHCGQAVTTAQVVKALRGR